MSRISLKTKLLGGLFMAVLIFGAVWALTSKRITSMADVYSGQIYGKINSSFSACPPQNFTIKAKDLSVTPPTVRSKTTNASGNYQFTNLPLHTYDMTAAASCPLVSFGNYQLPSGFCMTDGSVVSLTQSQPTFRADLTANTIMGLVRVRVLEVYDIPGPVRKSYPLSDVKVVISNGNEGITDENGFAFLYAEAGTQQVSAEYQSESYVENVDILGCRMARVNVSIR